MKLNDLIQGSTDEVADILRASDPVSVFEDYEQFKVLLLRRLDFQDHHLGFVPEAFVLTERGVFYLTDRTALELDVLPGGYRELLDLLGRFYRNNQRILHAYSDQIEQLEDYLFERRIPGIFMDIWFDLKKELSKLENYYYRNGIVYREFYRKCEDLFGDARDDFKDIEEEIQFHASNLGSLKGRLDGVHHYFDSIKNDRVTKTLFTLTVISGIFLPLNLIVGFFGINTPGLFFASDENGTRKVLIVLGAVLLVVVLGIPVVHLIDRYILRVILGRYDFYKNISTSIDALGERLRGK
jgi:magnesium transporter